MFLFITKIDVHIYVPMYSRIKQTYNNMALVQTSPFLGQIFKSNGEVDVIEDMSGTYQLYNSEDNELIGSAMVQRHTTNDTPYLDILLPCGMLSFEEMDYTSNNLGCKCWLGSFANVIYHTNNTNDASHTVLELGSGVGISGITLAKSNPSTNVTVSDGFEPLAITIRNNIKSNTTSNASFEKIKWGDDSTYNGPHDLVMGCECVYTDETQDLIDTIIYHLKDDGKAIFLNTPSPYRHGVQSFINNLKPYGLVTTKEVYLVRNSTIQAPFVVIEFTKRNDVSHQQ
jgi:2-polyprenyl-3-methyl-5-hydroxy-6-metoxy-1,4-benzoquinol methylase